MMDFLWLLAGLAAASAVAVAGFRAWSGLRRRWDAERDRARRMDESQARERDRVSRALDERVATDRAARDLPLGDARARIDGAPPRPPGGG